MEPPAKRLRILQSVEVDESDPDYVRNRERGDALMKRKWESVFDKYGAMHASMSDEIDMVTGKVVVDNGHLRRVARQQRQKAASLLDGLFAAGDDDAEEEEIKEDTDTRDELAPSQTPEPKQHQRNEGEKLTPSTSHTELAATTGQTSNQGSIQLPTATTALPPQCDSSAVIPSAAAPTTNLMELIQFPQTPGGQIAQNAFLASLAQTINFAVQQAVTPLLSNLLTKAPNTQLAATDAFAATSAPPTVGDNVKPATDPKWFFPPLTIEHSQSSFAQSSPLPASMGAPKIKSLLPSRSHNSFTNQIEVEEGIPVELVDNTLIALSNPSRKDLEKSDIEGFTTHSSPSERRQRHERSRIRPLSKFQEEDDAYIIRQRRRYNRSWEAIRDGRAEWEGWPLHAFQAHWQRNLKDKELDDDDEEEEEEDEEQDSNLMMSLGGSRSPMINSNARGSPAPSHHLPTPSSLKHADENSRREESRDFILDSIDDMVSSGGHFDEDDRELLSLAGAAEEREPTPFGDNEMQMFIPSPEEVVLPSIETPLIIEEEDIQHELSITPLGDTDATQTKPENPTIDNVVGGSRSSLVATRGNGPFACDTCSRIFKSSKNLERHQNNSCSRHRNVVEYSSLNGKMAARIPPDVDLVAQDELQVSMQPHIRIKSESCTPPPNLLNMSSVQTPSSAPQPRVGQASQDRTSASIANRSAFLKRVTQSWVKKSGKSAPVRRRDFVAVPKKRVWLADEDSVDELAL